LLSPNDDALPGFGRPQFDPSVFEIALRVSRLPRGSLVLIDGASGTGKTTLASEIVRVLGAVDVPEVIHMDDLYPGWDGLEQGIRNLHEWILEPRSAGKSVAWKRYNWVTGQFDGEFVLDTSRTVIVEGCGALGHAAHEYATLSFWVYADDDVRRERALARDPSEDFASHWDEWDEQFIAYVEREAPGSRASIHVRCVG
jgi:uridine kinase